MKRRLEIFIWILLAIAFFGGILFSIGYNLKP